MNAQSKTGVHFDACYERHDTGYGHPESAARYRVLCQALAGLPPEITRLERARSATSEDVLLVHDPRYHATALGDIQDGCDCLSTGDTAVCRDSYMVALEACGALLGAADAVMAGTVKRAFCAARPPGHHANATRGMGFCVFNNIAIAARHLQHRHGLKRLAIIDWDVHHGNGTEEIFYEDPDVLYVSLHQVGIYPGTGAAGRRGYGPGEGANLNIPLPYRSGGDIALAAWDALITPAIDAFRPEFLLISAGFDARTGDPIGGLEWTDETFAAMTRRCVAAAGRWCAGRLVSVLEGGYNPNGLASAAVAHVLALAEPAAPGLTGAPGLALP